MNHGELLAVPPATDLASHWWREHGRFNNDNLRNHIVSGSFACVLPRSTGDETIVDGLEFIIIVEVDNGNTKLMGNRVSWVDDYLG